MDSTARERIHAEAMRLDIHDLVAELNENVGAAVVQAMAGVKDRTSPYRWATSGGPVPRPDVEARLRLGWRVWRVLASSEGPNVSLAWLMGANPRLDEDLPVLCIQQQRTREVIGAAEAFVLE